MVIHSEYSLLAICGLLMFALGSVVVAQTQGEENTADSTSTGAISGQVISDTGAPIPNAFVLLRSVNSSPAFLIRRAVTDREGAFRLDGLDRGLYLVTVSAPSYVQPLRELNSPPIYYRVGDSITFTLVRGGVITGTITNALGEPIVGMNVRTVMVRDASGTAAKAAAPQFGERITDDRGVYRIYGLSAGDYLVSAGGRGNYSFFPGAFENDSPTYAPSATRDTAAEIEVTAGTETSAVDIRYRGEPGRFISGTVVRPTTQLQYPTHNVNLRRIRGGVAEFVGFAFTSSGGQGFSFYGVPDGEYELEVQGSVSLTEMAVSDPFRVTVKGADVSGIVLTPKLLANIAGRVVLEPSTSPQCQKKRRPSFDETVVAVQRSQESDPKERTVSTAFGGNQASPGKAGEFLLRNITPGRYKVNTNFFARYWFVKGLALAPATTTVGQQTDLSRTGIVVKSGERLTNLRITLAEGAASVRGTIKIPEGQSLSSGAAVFLVPSEREAVDNPLRYYAIDAGSDGAFSLTNLAPGKYWAIVRAGVRAGTPNDSLNARNIKDPSLNEKRLQLRREAETAKTSLELSPCQNRVDLQLPLGRP